MRGVSRIDQQQIARRLTDFVDLYREVYAEAPYGETDEDAAAFGERLMQEQERPGFAMITAEVDHRLVGFAYGLSFPADRWWKHADAEPSEVRGEQKFAIMELAVRSSHRGQGLSSLLVKALLQDRPEPYATLSTNPQAAAGNIYRRWGWHVVARSYRSDFPEMEILILRLPAAHLLPS